MKTEDEKMRNQFLKSELEQFMKKHRIKDISTLLKKTPEELMRYPDLAIQVISYIQKLKVELD